MYYNNQIWHWGVKGMKWGVRRYQNADGSLTNAGKRRYTTDAAANAKKKKDNRLPEESLNDPNRWVKEDRERMKRVVDSGNQMAGNLKTLNDKSMRIQARRTPKMDLSKMTDQEMREQINRAMLEKQYDDMFNRRRFIPVGKPSAILWRLQEVFWPLRVRLSVLHWPLRS